MLSLFTTTNVVSIVADVPVTGIEILCEDVVELNLDKGESFSIDYLVTPSEATKKDVSFIFTEYADEPLAEFSVNGNTVTPTSGGWAIVTLQTVDGGFRDSFIVCVKTTRVTVIESTLQNDSITVGEVTSLDTAFTPKNAYNQTLGYRVKEGADVVSISPTGKITGIGIGTAVIEVYSQDNPEATDEVTLTVNSSGVIDFVSDKSYLTALESSGSVPAVINPALNGFTVDIELLSQDSAQPLDTVISVSFDKATSSVNYTFLDPAFVGDIEIKLTVTPEGGESVSKSCYVSRISEISVDWGNPDADYRYAVENGGVHPVEMIIDLRPAGADVTYLLTANYKSATDLTGHSTVVSGTPTAIEEGVTYYCEGGYLSVQLVDNTLIIKGERVAEIIDDTTTELILTVVDNNIENDEGITLPTVTLVVFG